MSAARSEHAKKAMTMIMSVLSGGGDASCVVTITSKFAALLVAQARVGHRLGEWGRLAARETGMRQLSRFRIETADVPRAVETTAAMVA